MQGGVAVGPGGVGVRDGVAVRVAVAGPDVGVSVGVRVGLRVRVGVAVGQPRRGQGVGVRVGVAVGRGSRNLLSKSVHPPGSKVSLRLVVPDSPPGGWLSKSASHRALLP